MLTVSFVERLTPDKGYCQRRNKILQQKTTFNGMTPSWSSRDGFIAIGSLSTVTQSVSIRTFIKMVKKRSSAIWSPEKRKLILMNNNLHQRSDNGRFYKSRKEGGSEIASLKDCVIVTIHGVEEHRKDKERTMSCWLQQQVTSIKSELT